MASGLLTGTLHMTRAHLAHIGDPDSNMTFGTSGRSDSTVQTGGARNYANGSTRMIAGTAINRVVGLTAVGVTQDERDQIIAMMGKTCVFRDTYGRKLFVVFLQVDVSDIPLTSPSLANVTLQSLTVVTYDEEV